MPTSKVIQSTAASQREELVPACTPRLRDVAGDAIRLEHGNARAAAIDMAIHEGHLSRSLKDGTLRLEQLECLGPAFAARFGAELVERFAVVADPKVRLRLAIRNLRRAVEEVAEAEAAAA